MRHSIVTKNRLNIILLALVLGFSLSAFTAHGFSLPPYSAHTRQQNWTCYAESQHDADVAILRAESLWQNFSTALNPGINKAPIPIVIAMGGLSEDSGFQNGEVRVFPTGSLGYKIQVVWTKLPVEEEAFDRSILRAFTLRLGLESVPKNMRDKVKVTIPAWVPEGFSIIFSENDVAMKYQGWGTLIARFEPSLSINQILTELDDLQKFDEAQRAISAALCLSLLKQPAVRTKFLSTFARSPELSPGEWLSRVTDKKGFLLDEWWGMAWKEQAALFPIVRLAYGTSRNWISDYEKSLQSNSEPTSGFTQYSMLLNPWFDRWVQNQKGLSTVDERLKSSQTYRTDVQLRRSLCLDWFQKFEKEGQLEQIQRWSMDGFSDVNISPTNSWFDQFGRE